MLKVFNPLLQLVTTQMYGYEILCSNGAWRGREIIFNPIVGCFLIRQLAVFQSCSWLNHVIIIVVIKVYGQGK